MNKTLRLVIPLFAVIALFLVSCCCWHHRCCNSDHCSAKARIWAMDWNPGADDCRGNLWRVDPTAKTGHFVCRLSGVGGQDGWVTVAEAPDHTLYFAHANNSPNSIYKLSTTTIPAGQTLITPTSGACHLVPVADPIKYNGQDVNPNIVGLAFGPDKNLYFAALVSSGGVTSSGAKIDSALYRVNLVDSMGAALTTATVG